MYNAVLQYLNSDNVYLSVFQIVVKEVIAG